MTLHFTKYHGAGNDFILVDNRVQQWIPTVEKIAFLCDRHFGIGADGLMLLSEDPKAAFRMTYSNCDGRESTLCGNGGRCIAAFARRLGWAGDFIRFNAVDGEHLAEVLGEEKNETRIRLKMQDTHIKRQFEDGIAIDTGSPHFVQFFSDTHPMDVLTRGRALRHDPRFSPGGANIDFAIVQNGKVSLRTYERGVEDETLSCGTGVTATALAASFLGYVAQGTVEITTRGGKLTVSFKQSGNTFSEIWLEGPATFVFEGKIEI